MHRLASIVLMISTSFVLGCASEEPSFHSPPSAPRTPTPAPAIPMAAPAPTRGEAPLPVVAGPLSAATTVCHQRAIAALLANPGHILPARADLECACEGGEPTSCAALGSLHAADGEAPDPALSLAALRRACALDDSFGCTNLGVALSGLYGDPAGARDAWLRGCDLGDGLGCANAASSIGLGRAGPPDVSRARELYRLACERGDTRSCTYLATIGL